MHNAPTWTHASVLGIVLAWGCIAGLSAAAPSAPDPAAAPSAATVASAAAVHGRIFLPAGQSRQRASRGRLYRSRGRQNAGQEDAGGTRGTRFGDVVVSAHPLSFEVDVDPLPEPARIVQRGTAFEPHVTPVTVGSTVAFVNEDPFYHNVFSLTSGAKFNIGRRPTGDVVRKKIPSVKVNRLGEIELFCDIHTQMNAAVLSLDTPYYVRAAEGGTYRLEGLPAGTYRLSAYHPERGTQETEVTVAAGDDVQRNFSFSL